MFSREELIESLQDLAAGDTLDHQRLHNCIFGINVFCHDGWKADMDVQAAVNAVLARFPEAHAHLGLAMAGPCVEDMATENYYSPSPSGHRPIWQMQHRHEREEDKADKEDNDIDPNYRSPSPSPRRHHGFFVTVAKKLFTCCGNEPPPREQFRH